MKLRLSILAAVALLAIPIAAYAHPSDGSAAPAPAVAHPELAQPSAAPVSELSCGSSAETSGAILPGNPLEDLAPRVSCDYTCYSQANCLSQCGGPGRCLVVLNCCNCA